MSDNLVLTVPKDRVTFEDDFAIVDTGMPTEDFVIAILKFCASDEHIMAVVKKKEAEE